MNILFINIFVVGFTVYEIPRVSVVGHCPYSVTFRIRLLSLIVIPYMQSTTSFNNNIISHISYYPIYNFIIL